MKKFEYFYTIEMLAEGFEYYVPVVERTGNACRIMHYTFYYCFKTETDAAKFAAQQKDFYNPDKVVKYYKIVEG